MHTEQQVQVAIARRWLLQAAAKAVLQRFLGLELLDPSIIAIKSLTSKSSNLLCSIVTARDI